jgi:hypothetical protein
MVGRRSTLTVNRKRFSDVIQFRVTAPGRVENWYFARGLGPVKVETKLAGIRRAFGWNFVEAKLGGKVVKSSAQLDKGRTRGERAIADAKVQAKNGLAYLGGALVKGAAEGQLLETAEELASPQGLASLGAFSGVAYGTQKGLETKGATKAFQKVNPRMGKFIKGTLPMGLGITAGQMVITGNVDPVSVGVATGAYTGANIAVTTGTTKVVSLGMLNPVKRLLESAGARGKIASAALTVAQMAATLTIGEKIEQAVANGTRSED